MTKVKLFHQKDVSLKGESYIVSKVYLWNTVAQGWNKVQIVIFSILKGHEVIDLGFILKGSWVHMFYKVYITDDSKVMAKIEGFFLSRSKVRVKVSR